MKKIDETGDVARKEGSGRPKSVRTEENIELVEEMILSKKDQPETHSTPAEIALELNVDRRSVFCIIDQNLGPLENWFKHVQESYCEGIFRKNYKLHSLAKKR